METPPITTQSTTTKPTSGPLEALQSLVKTDYNEFNALMDSHLQQAPIELIHTIGNHIIKGGGKRLRPLMVLLSTRMANYQGPHHTQVAVAIEFFHTSTLLHDDVVDDATLRRGQQSANTLWDNKASVLVGDYLFSKAIQLMVGTKNLGVLELLADASNTITQGEILQLEHIRNPKTSEAHYHKVIGYKTATLFSAAAKMGPILAGSPKPFQEALASYGSHVGYAFQLVDDALDYCADASVMGKSIGQDLAEGKPTLPLIHALHHSTPSQQQFIQRAIESGKADDLTEILSIIHDTGSIEYTYVKAQEALTLAIQALEALPASPYKKALIQLANFSVNRQF